MTTDLRAHADDFASLIGTAPLPRRAFVAASLGGGFAAAVAPTAALRAQVVVTDDAGLVNDEVLITTADGRRMPAWRAQPVGRSALSTVLVVHEAFGVHEHIRDVCRRFARPVSRRLRRSSSSARVIRAATRPSPRSSPR